MSGKPGSAGEFDTCQENIGKLVSSQRSGWEKSVEKSCLLLTSCLGQHQHLVA